MWGLCRVCPSSQAWQRWQAPAGHFRESGRHSSPDSCSTALATCDLPSHQLHHRQFQRHWGVGRERGGGRERGRGRGSQAFAVLLHRRLLLATRSIFLKLFSGPSFINSLCDCWVDVMAVVALCFVIPRGRASSTGFATAGRSALVVPLVLHQEGPSPPGGTARSETVMALCCAISRGRR